MTQPHTYTGLAFYRLNGKIIEGIPVRNAQILTLQPINLSAYVSRGRAVLLTITNPTGHGPAQLEVATWGTPDDWQPTPPAPINPIVSTLTNAGLPASLHLTRYGDVGAVLHLARMNYYCQLVIVERNNTLHYQFLGQHGHEPAFYAWDGARTADAPTHVRRFCREFHARILQTRPADAVPGQPLHA
ncbi:hypothetical protein [Kitasatospora cineracea]|uniref:hypothetical protein n=1 Tax=Kitasatospora cineracea TaxID=88074 RepID=UPI0036CA0135